MAESAAGGSNARSSGELSTPLAWAEKASALSSTPSSKSALSMGLKDSALTLMRLVKLHCPRIIPVVARLQEQLGVLFS
jgi:hypothetical protein